MIGGYAAIFLLTFAISYVILLNVMDPTASPCQRGWHGKTFYANCNGANGDVAMTDHGYTVYGEPLWMVPVIVLNRGKRGWGE